MSVTREEVKEWLRDWERDYVSLSEGPDAGHWDQRLACARAALAALDDAERKEVQALKGELLDELAARGWMLMDLSCSTIVRAVAGDPRKPNREATGPNWRVRRNNGYYSYGETPDMAILAGLADEANEATPKAARAGGA